MTRRAFVDLHVCGMVVAAWLERTIIRLMALCASSPIVRRPPFGRDCVVGIVASQTTHLVAFKEAAALPQPVGVMVDLEAFRSLLSQLVDICGNDVIGQRLAGTIAVRRASETPYTEYGRRSLEMALVAHIVPKLRFESSRIDDRRPIPLGVRFTGLCDSDVFRTGTMTPLATDPFR